MTIYKYQLHTELNRLEIPGFERLLHVGCDPGGCLCVWVLIDKADDEIEPLRLNVIGTGWDFNANGQSYVGSVTIGQFVWHVWREL